jgi:hypothetical protein
LLEKNYGQWRSRRRYVGISRRSLECGEDRDGRHKTNRIAVHVLPHSLSCTGLDGYTVRKGKVKGTGAQA